MSEALQSFISNFSVSTISVTRFFNSFDRYNVINDYNFGLGNGRKEEREYIRRYAHGHSQSYVPVQYIWKRNVGHGNVGLVRGKEKTSIFFSGLESFVNHTTRACIFGDLYEEIVLQRRYLLYYIVSVSSHTCKCSLLRKKTEVSTNCSMKTVVKVFYEILIYLLEVWELLR